MSTPKITDFFNHVDLWLPQEDGTILISTVRGSIDVTEFKFETSELSALHPDLPAATRALFAHAKSESEFAQVYGSDIRYTLACLQRPPITFRDVLRTPYQFIDIYEFRYPENKRDSVFLRGTRVSTKTVTIDNRSVPFVTYHNNSFTRVSIEELDEHFPGWQARWDVACTLELPMTELADFVLNCSPTKDVSMNNITFG